MGFPILTVLALLPAVGAISLIFFRGALAKQVALAVSVLALLLAVILALQFDASVTPYTFTFRITDVEVQAGTTKAN